MDDPPDTAEPELVATCAVNPEFDSVKDNLSVASKLDDLTLCNLCVSAKAPWQPGRVALVRSQSVLQYFAAVKSKVGF